MGFGGRSSRFLGWPIGDEPPVDEDEQPIGEGPRLGAVVDDDERGFRARTDRGQRILKQGRAHLGVEAGERFVEQQDIGSQGDRAREMDPASLPAGQRRRGASREVRGADHPERRFGPLRALAARHAPPAERQRHVCEHRAAGEIRCLECDGDPTVARDVTGPRFERPGERIQQRALAGAVRSQQRDDLTGAELDA